MQETWNHKVTWGCWMKKGNTFKASEPLQNEHLLLTRAFKLFNYFPISFFAYYYINRRCYTIHKTLAKKKKRRAVPGEISSE